MQILCEKCKKPMVEKHRDKDRNNVNIVWFRCKSGHWKSVTYEEYNALSNRETEV